MTTTIWPLRRAVRLAPDRVAVRCGRLALTYAEMWERAGRLVGALQGLGVQPGDRVAVVSGNCHRYLEIYQAVPGAGMVLVPLNPRHTTSELAYALEDSGAKVLFAGAGIEVPEGLVPHAFDMADGYEALLADATRVDLPGDFGGDTLAGLFYTGGTTGASKGVMLTHRNLIANTHHLQAATRFGPETAWLVAAPLFHLAGSIAVLSTVWSTGEQVMLAAFDAAHALDLIQTTRVTATLLVPTMLAALSEEQLVRPRDVSTLGLICHGGSPIAAETLRRAHAAFPAAELMHIYGATETAPIVTVLPREERLLDSPQAGSCGPPSVGVEVEIVDPISGQPAPVGTVGEVAVRGDNVMTGYWHKPEATKAALVDGRYRTGDLGYVDEHHFLYLVDRSRDMIVTGGENVYSTEVEDVLYRHEAVLEAAVFGVPDRQWGEAVHAVVVPRRPVEVDELLRHCRDAIATYKVPKRIELRSEPLPKSGAGKILKRELRAPHWAGSETLVAGA